MLARVRFPIRSPTQHPRPSKDPYRGECQLLARFDSCSLMDVTRMPGITYDNTEDDSIPMELEFDLSAEGNEAEYRIAKYLNRYV